MHARVFRPFFDRKEVVRHRLVRELVNERRDDVHRAVSHNQRRALPPGILLLVSLACEGGPVSLRNFFSLLVAGE
jgi:hypothetical protein